MSTPIQLKALSCIFPCLCVRVCLCDECMFVGAFACDTESHPQLPFYAVRGGRVSQSTPELAAITSLSFQLVLENSRWAATPTQHLRGIGGFELQFSCLQQKLFNLLAISPHLPPALRGFVCLFVAFLFVFNYASPHLHNILQICLCQGQFPKSQTGPHNLDLSVTLPGSFLGVSETLQASRDRSVQCPGPLCATRV